MVSTWIFCYIYSYLASRKQCARINNTTNAFYSILPGVLQGSVVGPILFNANFDDLFVFIEKASIGNFADNSSSSFPDSFEDLLKSLKLESKVAID